jgi:hypothetical protein
VAVPGNKACAPTGLADTELFAVDAYRRVFDSPVVAVDREQNRVALARTTFYEIERAREIMVTFLRQAVLRGHAGLYGGSFLNRWVDDTRSVI